tara:strand:+ start:1929 stop:2867 length:939 start_codon:yes stop_codon:yes gene_type:complete
MKNIYGKHTFYFSVLTIIFSVITLIFAKNFEFSNQTIVPFVCLFLILSVGISHGALDNYKANKILKIYKINNKLVFYFSYISISILIIISWIFFSLITLLAFLLIASYHFGREDTSFLIKKNSSFDQILYLVKGSLIIFSPLFFHTDETLKIFELLFINNSFLIFIKNEHWVINVCLIFNFLGYLYFVFRNNFDNFEILFLDLLLILLINFVFSPLLAFTIYFCFLHSIRHIISIVLELDEANFSNGIKLFIKKALPLTIITAILYLLAVFFIANFNGLNTAIMQVIFIGLASLTFPHILLEYLIEKNETKN